MYLSALLFVEEMHFSTFFDDTQIVRLTIMEKDHSQETCPIMQVILYYKISYIRILSQSEKSNVD